MTRSELIAAIARQYPDLDAADVERAVKVLLEQMSAALAAGERIEVRGFGAFSLRTRAPCTARNPKTGESLSLPRRHRPHFVPGKALRERVNAPLAALAPA